MNSENKKRNNSNGNNKQAQPIDQHLQQKVHQILKESMHGKNSKRFTFDQATLHDSSVNSQSMCSAAEITKNSSEETQKALNNEIQILKTLDHANIIKYYESFSYKKHLCIVTEYAQNGDLQRRIKEAKNSGKVISQQQILDWFCQMALALGHIHSKNILHRDLKPKNILLTKSNIIKIGDFGISKMLDHTFDMAKTATGTPYYLSPEVCLGQRYDNKSDMWMLGCILYEMCALKRPFEGESLNQVLNRILKDDPKKLSSHFDPIFHKLIDLLLQKSASLRASIQEILDLPELRDILERNDFKKFKVSNQTQDQFKYHYVQPISQKKHAQIKDKKGIYINNFMLENEELQKKQQSYEGLGDKEISSNQKAYTDYLHSQKKQVHFNGELTFGGQNNTKQNNQNNQIAVQRANQVKSQQEQYNNLNAGQIYRLQVPKNGQSKSVTRFNDTNTSQLESSPDSIIVPNSTSMAEYQGYNNFQQSRPLSQMLVQNSKTKILKGSVNQNKSNAVSRQIRGQKQYKKQNGLGFSNQQDQSILEIPTDNINNSSHNIMQCRERMSPIIAESTSQNSSKPYHSQNKSVISQSSNEKDLNRKLKIQDLLQKAKNLTSPNQAMDQRGRDFVQTKDNDEVDSETFLHKIQSPHNEDDSNFNSQHFQAKSPQKFMINKDHEYEEQDFNGNSQSNKAWLSAERANNQRESVKQQNTSYRSILIKSNNQNQSTPSPSIEKSEGERRQQIVQQFNESSNMIYNQGLVNNTSFNNQLDISTISKRPFRPSTQMSDENQNIDETDSEQIGKRTTIHSMLSVLSLFSSQNPGQQHLGKNLKVSAGNNDLQKKGSQILEQGSEYSSNSKQSQIKVKSLNNRYPISNDGYNKIQNQQLIRELKGQVVFQQPNNSLDLNKSSKTTFKPKKLNQLMLKKQQKSSQDNLINNSKSNLLNIPQIFDGNQHQSFDQISQKSDQKNKYKSALIQRNIPKKNESSQIREDQRDKLKELDYIDQNLTSQQNAEIIKIKGSNQSLIEVKFTQNFSKQSNSKSKAEQLQKQSKNQINRVIPDGRKTMTSSQSSLTTNQTINNINQLLNKKSIQINTTHEPNQSKKQYEKALAQAKKYIKQKVDTDSNPQSQMVTLNDDQIKQTHENEGQNQKDKKQKEASISCGNITLMNIKNSSKSQIKDKPFQHGKFSKGPGNNSRDIKMLQNHSISKSGKNNQPFDNIQNSNQDNLKSKKGEQTIAGQFSPGSIYIQNSFHQLPGFKNQQSRLIVNGSEKSVENKSCSGRSATSSDTQINIIRMEKENQTSKMPNNDRRINQQMKNQTKTMNSMSLKQKVGQEVYLKEQKLGGQMIDSNQSNQRTNMSAQKSNSTIYEQSVFQRANNQFITGNKEGNFSNMNKQQAKTPQDNSIKNKNYLFDSYLSDSCNHSNPQNLSQKRIGNNSKDEDSDIQLIFDKDQSLNADDDDKGRHKPIISQMKLKQIYTTTNQQQMHGQIGQYILGQKKEVITSKSGLVQHQMLQVHDQYTNQASQIQSKQQTKYFTFDQNGIFNPKNPVSPARGHLATEFIKQRLGKQRYDKILNILERSENPIQLLDKHSNLEDASQDIKDQKKQILQLINNDKNFLSIFQYIVNCSMYFWQANEQQSVKDSSQNQSNTGSKEEARSASQFSIAHTPNSGFTLNSNYQGNDAEKILKSNLGGAQSFTKKMSYDSSEVEDASSAKHKININKQNSIGQYSSDVSNLGLIGLTSAKSGPEAHKMQFHRPQDSINSIGKGKKTDVQYKLFTPSTQYTNNLGKQSDENPVRIKQRRQTFQISESTISDQTQQVQPSINSHINKFGLMQSTNNQDKGPEEDSVFSRIQQMQNQQARTPAQHQTPSLRQLFKQRDISIEKYKIQLPSNNKDKSVFNQAPIKDFRVKSSKSGQHFTAIDNNSGYKQTNSPLISVQNQLKSQSKEADDDEKNTINQLNSVFNF